MEYTVDYFINFFEDVPEHCWCINTFTDHFGRSCANGLLGCSGGLMPFAKTAASIAITPLIAMLPLTYKGLHVEDVTYGYSNKLAKINNGNVDQYQQATPKQRVLAALRDVKVIQVAEADKLIEKSLMAEEPNLQLVTQ